MKKKVVVLGAGFTGLTCAYELLKKDGYSVSVFEKEAKPGGLAVGFKKPNWDWTLEQSYHHIFTSDQFAINLAKELEIPIIFKRPLTATYTHGKILPLDSPQSLLQFPYLSYWERIKTGATLGYLKLTPFWQNLEKITAKEWLVKYQGKKVYQELWEPLFIGKFGKYAERISMIWFWARIFKRSSSLGYFCGGYQVLADKLADKIKSLGGKISYNTEVKRIEPEDNQIVISTLPTPVFLKLFPQLPANYQKQLSQIPHLHALNLVLELKQPFLSGPYWLNINDPTFPFLAVVEHTNFMDKKYYGGNPILYIGNYLPQNHKYFQMTKNELLKLFLPYLKKINPDLDSRFLILDSHLFVSPFAQPVITVNYSKIKPSLATPLPNLYIGNLDSVYPWDRGTNYAIELGQKLAMLNRLC